MQARQWSLNSSRDRHIGPSHLSSNTTSPFPLILRKNLKEAFVSSRGWKGSTTQRSHCKSPYKYYGKRCQTTSLCRAIARSLQESSNPERKSAPAEVIEIIDDDDDNDEAPADSTEDAQFEADLRRAMAVSKAASGHSSTSASQHASRASSSSVQEMTPLASSRPGGAFLFDRAQMERERLERQKRLRPDVASAPTSASASSSTHQDNEEDEDEDAAGTRSAKRQRVSSSSYTQRTNALSSSRTVTPARTSSGPGRSRNEGEGNELFFEGELRQTANKHVDPAKDTRPLFRLTDILAPVRPPYFAEQAEVLRGSRETRSRSLSCRPMSSTCPGSTASSTERRLLWSSRKTPLVRPR